MMLKMKPLTQHVQESSESISPAEISPSQWGQKLLSCINKAVTSSSSWLGHRPNTQQCTAMSDLLAGRFIGDVSQPGEPATKTLVTDNTTKLSVETPSHADQRAKLFAQLGIRSTKISASLEEIEKLIATLSHIEAQKRIDAAHTIAVLYPDLPPEKQMHARINLILMTWRDADTYARIAAIKTLGKTRMPDVSEALQVALRDEEQIVRAAAARALGEIPGKTAVIALVAVTLHKNEHWSVRAAAIRAMGTSGERTFLNTITLALEDEDDSVRIAAIQALVQLEGIQAAPRLALIAQRDQQPHIKHAAILALENLGTGNDKRHT